MLKIRPDQIEALAQATIARRRGEVAEALDTGDAEADAMARLQAQWFDVLVATGIRETAHLVRALTLLSHYRVRSGDPLDWMLLAVLLREEQEPEPRLAFAERHLLPRLAERE
ncbi:MAG: hypothetical protein R3B72_31835 [Polyangiaceae bacterium]